LRSGNCWSLLRSLIVSVALDRPEHSKSLARELLGNCTDDQRVVDWTLRNDVALLFSGLTESFDGVRGEGVEALRRAAEDAYTRARHMANLVETVSATFEEGGIEYAVFKTFNRAERIDVDVDVVIDKGVYWEAVRLLTKRGFKPVDDVTKTYATGFMLPQNPIVLDLHTEITVLGLPYFEAELILRNRVKAGHVLGGIEVETYTAKPHVDAALRIAHAVIKEAEIRIDDVTEVLNALILNSSGVEDIAKKSRSLRTSYKLFLQMLETVLISLELPHKLSEVGRLKALADLVLSLGPRRVLEALTNLRYRRSAAMVGKAVIRAVKQP